MKQQKNFWKVVGVAMALPIIFAILDVWGYHMWKALGGWSADAYVMAEPYYQGIFWTFAYVVIAGIAITYYILRKDKSEALALVIVPYIMLQHGVEDVIFYLIRGLNIFTDTLPWLEWNLWPVTIYAKIFTGGVITGTLVVCSAIFGTILAYLVARRLLKA